MRVPPQARNCVVFLGYEKGGQTYVAGTGFVVDVPSQDHPELHWPYLVTARHVAEALDRSIQGTRRSLQRIREALAKCIHCKLAREEDEQ